MDTKRLTRVEIKDADRGEVDAVFSTFDVIDSDGDVTDPKAFEDGATIVVSAYGHRSWMGDLPVGVGKIRTTDTEAVAETRFFVDTSHGSDTFSTVKRLHEAGLGDWSYGYDVLEADQGERDGKQVRFLRKLKVHEVSPVLRGAGVDTRTLSAKGFDPGTAIDLTTKFKRAIAVHETDVVSRDWDANAVMKAIPDDARPSDLRTVFAWVDPDGDPEAKTSYRFPHHHGVGGPANVRALTAGIAILNGARGGTAIPEADRKAVHDHLAAHLHDADREPPELRDRGTAPTKFNDELLEGLAEVSLLLDSASRVVAARGKQGRRLSRVSTDYLAWIGADLERLKRLLDTNPEVGEPFDPDEVHRTLVAAVARVHDL